MNKRILELAEQAGFVTWSDEEWKPKGAVIDWASDYDKELEKFAELIVREIVRDISQMIESQDVDPAFKHRMSWAVKDRYGVK